MSRLKSFVYGILAGISISIGGIVFLSVDNKIIGSLFFTVGLFTICSFGFNLYTGKVCYLFNNKISYVLDLILIWLGNLAGTVGCAVLMQQTRYSQTLWTKAASLVNVKMADSPLSIFILSFFCDILIYIAVEGYKSIPYEFGKYLALFFGVTVFILCGFEHCVANMFYISMANMWDQQTAVYVLIMTLGNSLGGVFIPLVRKAFEK